MHNTLDYQAINLQSPADATLRIIAKLQSAQIGQLNEEHQVDMNIYSQSLSVLGDTQDTATFIAQDLKQAKQVYEALYEAKRMDWSIQLEAACIWANGEGGIHMHACNVTILRSKPKQPK